MPSKPHWTYYLRGAAGEELAQYSGVKSLDGSAVALFAEQYSVAGEFIVAPDGEKWYFIYDHQGNVRCKYKKDEAQFFDYTPFGAEINSNYNDPNGWISSERDFESRYMNLQARLYDPVIGRFLAVDPLFEMQIGINPYHYCGNDPVNYSDPSGLSWDIDENGEYHTRARVTIKVEGTLFTKKHDESNDNSGAIIGMTISGCTGELAGAEVAALFNQKFLNNPRGKSSSGGGGSGGLFIPWQNESNAKSSSNNSNTKAVQNASNAVNGVSVTTSSIGMGFSLGGEYWTKYARTFSYGGALLSWVTPAIEYGITGTVQSNTIIDASIQTGIILFTETGAKIALMTGHPEISACIIVLGATASIGYTIYTIIRDN